MGLLLVALLVGAACSGSGAEPAAGPTSAPASATSADGERPQLGLAGDSMMASLTPALRAALGPAGAEAAFTLYPELPRRATDIESSAAAFAELGDVVVFMIGVWEGSILSEGENDQVDPSSPDWQDTYRDRVVIPWLEAVAGHGTSVVWVGMTRVADPLQALGFGELNTVYQQATDRVPGADFVDAGALLAGPDGRFQPSITTPAGTVLRLNAIDGLHLCPDGAAHIADAVVATADESLPGTADPDWRATDWTRHDRVKGRHWYDVRRCG